MVCIYRIYNIFTEESYVGQTRNFEQRMRSHFNNKSYSVFFDKMMNYEGYENFRVEIIEQFDENVPQEILDEREDFYIQFYDCVFSGYNLKRGGQHCRGESNANVKLTEQEVYDIREAYKNHKNKHDVFQKYSNKVTWYYFSNLWEGVSWKNIHMDVYTSENKYYYTYTVPATANLEFTPEEVLELRKRYVTESARDIYESVKDRCKYQTFQMILWGRYYKNIPVYDKKHKIWKNVNN